MLCNILLKHEDLISIKKESSSLQQKLYILIEKYLILIKLRILDILSRTFAVSDGSEDFLSGLLLV